MWIFGKLKRYFNQNTYKIIATIAICIFVIFVIQILNFMAKSSNEKNNAETPVANNIQSQTQKPELSSPITDTTISENTGKTNEELIKEFINTCNNGDIETAYNLLGTDCKNELYPNITDFQKNYFNTIFQSKKIVTTEFWDSKESTYTYKVRILEDALSTGKYQAENIAEDFYTIISENSEKKLNINGFISKKEIKKSTDSNGIQIEVKNKYMYKEYEKYDISIRNNTNKTISAIDLAQSSNTIYITDENGTTYSAYMNEIIPEKLIVKPDQIQNFSIKYNKLYNTQKQTKTVNFSQIILDYETYINGGESQTTGITINL